MRASDDTAESVRSCCKESDGKTIMLHRDNEKRVRVKKSATECNLQIKSKSRFRF